MKAFTTAGTDVMDLDEFCERMGITPETGRSWCRKELIHCVNVGRAYKISRAWYEDFLRGGGSATSFPQAEPEPKRASIRESIAAGWEPGQQSQPQPKAA
jgi:hypothetical protein